MESEQKNALSSEEPEKPLGTRERLQKTLLDRAATLKTVQAEVYTVNKIRLIINFIMGVIAVALLIVTIIKVNEFAVMLPCLIVGLVLVIATLVLYFTAKYGYVPMSYIQYSVKKNDKTYVVQSIARDRAVFFDGDRAVEYNNGEATLKDAPFCPELRNDFFVDMTVNMRVGKADTETFYGTLDVDGKTKKCVVRFKNGVLEKGSVGGRRMRYYAVNDTTDAVAVPAALKDAAKKFNVPWPDVPGIKLRKPFDEVK
ncbi:MAG: hypothetical protein J1F39_03435 [Clostridiales bacterium]|nr:hypothetical protein [Clostridiales bacterium]